MKKLMCAIAAVSAGICLADVTSANVVGYQNKEVTPNTMNISCSTFLPVGTDGSKAVLGDIKANDTFAFAEDNLQLLTGTGGTLAQYTYCNEEWAAEFESTGLKVGWYDYEEISNWDWESTAPESKNNVELPFGSMFILQSGYEGAALIYAGQVLDADKEFEIVPGTMNMLGNATPVDLTLGDIKANDTFAFAEDNLQTLTGTGGTLAQYTYCNEAWAAEFESTGLKVGWYDYEEISNWDWESTAPESKNSLPIPSGYGFIIQSGYEGAGIIIPSPLAD